MLMKKVPVDMIWKQSLKLQEQMKILWSLWPCFVYLSGTESILNG